MADNDEQKGKHIRIPLRRERADERVARPANLAPAEGAQAEAEARRRDVAQTAVTIHGDRVPRPSDAQTSVNVEIATRQHDEQTTFAPGERPEPAPSPIQITNVRCTVWLNGVRVTGRCSGTFTPSSP